jgi:acyl-CoA reductase-like NAD-dependent aldehyde dehydrogenase
MPPVILITDRLDVEEGKPVKSSRAPAFATAAAHAAGSTQQSWADTSVANRLRVLRSLRHRLAADPTSIIDAFPASLARTRADSLAAEVLPLLEACRFLERRAPSLLAPRRLGSSGRPVWLAGVESTVERIPYGRILIIAPANYPLFLPGVQALQALVTGNAVVWKPGTGGAAVALHLAAMLSEAGLPEGLLRITGESIAAATHEIETLPDKIIFTGSAEAGRAVARMAAERTIPLVTELSGADAVVALPTADPARLADALCFGMRLNGSATCMAPRRLFLIGDAQGAVIPELIRRFSAIRGVPLQPETRSKLRSLLRDAELAGARVEGDVDADDMRPILVLDAKPAMHITQADIFAPVLSVIRLASEQGLLAADRLCPFGLTVSVWGEPRAAEKIARRFTAGTLLVNDLIVPTADPRIPFGGRRGSGFGVTRGAEGLLEMTATRTIQIRRNSSTRHFAQTFADHEPFFASLASLLHGQGPGKRFAALRRLVSAARKMK